MINIQAEVDRVNASIRERIKITVDQWNKIGQYVVGKIRQDALQGEMQNDTSGHQYTREYALIKARSFRYATSRVYKQNVANAKSIGIYAQAKDSIKKAGGKKGNRYKGYESLPLNTNTAFVNLTLTGDMLKSLQVVESLTTEDGCTLAYGQDQTKKILGNKKRGYDVTTLSTENRKIIHDLIRKAIVKNLRRGA